MSQEVLFGVFRDCKKCSIKCEKRENETNKAHEFIRKAQKKYGEEVPLVGVGRTEIEENQMPEHFPEFIYLLKWEKEEGHTYLLNYVLYENSDGMIVFDFLKGVNIDDNDYDIQYTGM